MKGAAMALFPWPAIEHRGHMDTSITTGFEPYRPRSLRFAGVRDIAGSRIKCYRLGLPGRLPDSSTLEAALDFAAGILVPPRRGPVIAGTDWARVARHGLGWLIVHRGREGVFAILDLWVGENMLEHHVAMAPATGPSPFEPLPATAAAMCVWELAVIAHEREAWLRHMLTAEGRGSAAAYLADAAEDLP